ncbi:MAG: hypothetical protein ACRBEQ_07890 [Hyphomonas sp.]
MMGANTYTSGTLLWLDDNFLDEQFLAADSDVDFWRKTFGEADHRVYRLLNLDLETVVSVQELEQAADEYIGGRDVNDRMVFAVVDLSVPEKTPDEADDTDRPEYRPAMANGLFAAQYLRDRNIPFVFLSSSSDATEDLISRGLERVPYFSKASDNETSLMPQEAARYILGEYRSRIFWLDINDTVQHFSIGSSRGEDSSASFAMGYFPFFGPYRDFVERWELRSEYVYSSNRTVLRAPQSHSAAFIKQCIALICNGQKRLRRSEILFFDSESVTVNQIETLSRSSDLKSVILRFEGSKGPVNEQRENYLLRLAVDRLRRHQVFFVLPPDESADKLLHELANVQGIFHDDLPHVRQHDLVAREQLIRNSVKFTLHKKSWLAGEQGPQFRGLYDAHPEILIDPLYWTFILEADVVDENISDPYEVLLELAESIEDLPVWGGGADRQVLAAIEQERPLAPENFWRPAKQVFEQEKKMHPTWVARTFANWLSHSWHTPFGLVADNHPYRKEFSEQCLAVAVDLAEKYFAFRQLDQLAERDGFESELLRAMDEAAAFLLHPAVCALMNNEEKIDWRGFDGAFWPFGTFPVPSALNERMSRLGGRYFFSHARELRVATLLEDGQAALERLEVRASFLNRRLDWIDSAVPHLPEGWQGPVAYLKDIVASRDIESAWHTNRDRVWNYISCLQQNAIRASYIFNTLVSWDSSSDKKKLKAKRSKLISASGVGELLGVIRGNRGRTFPEEVQPFIGLPMAQNVRLAQTLQALDDMLHFVSASTTNGSDAPVIMDILRALHGGLQGKSEADGNIEDEMMSVLYMPDSPFTASIIRYSEGFDPGESGKRDKDARHATGVELLMAMTRAGAGLNHFMRPLVFADGYHFLNSIGDRRNAEKNVTPDLAMSELNQALELFLLGIEGLVLQLKWILYKAGEIERADAIPDGYFKLAKVPEADPGLVKDFARVLPEDQTFRVYMLGFFGGNKEQFAFNNSVEGAYSVVKL